MYPGSKDYHSRLIRTWAAHYQMTGQLPVLRQGKHVKVTALINDEDVALKCRAIFRGIKRNLRTAERFMEEVNGQIPGVHISLATAKRWLSELGFFSGQIKKGTYKDGHEDAIVVADREGRFCPQMIDHRKCMDTFEGTHKLGYYSLFYLFFSNGALFKKS